MSDRPGVDAPAWHFLQSDLWARHKSEFGWRPVRLSHEHRRGLAGLLTLTRDLPLGVRLTYVPYAPAIAIDSDVPGAPGPAGPQLSELLEEATPAIVDAVRRETGGVPTLVRYDLPQIADDTVGSSGSPLVRSPVEVQPPSTVVLDLRRDDETLLAEMHKKNRYNIRLAERKGVTVRLAGMDEIDRWYGLYQETSERDGIAIHSKAYYRTLFAYGGHYDEPRLRLYFAEHESDLLAGIVVVQYGSGATYLYGASSNRKRNLMPNYAVQWRAIREAREAGCTWYDMFGVPPADDPAHPMHGLFRFKTGFGGRLLHRLGSWDALVKPASGRLFRLAERARDVYHHGLRHSHAR